MFGQNIFEEFTESWVQILDSQHVISQNSSNYSIFDLGWFWCGLVSLISFEMNLISYENSIQKFHTNVHPSTSGAQGCFNY